MSAVYATITIDLPDNIDFNRYTDILKQQISKINGYETTINVIEVDNPIAISPINIKKVKD